MISLEKILEENRRELLDLSTRNRLLSMPVETKTARVVHISDERSDEIFRLLVTEKKNSPSCRGVNPARMTAKTKQTYLLQMMKAINRRHAIGTRGCKS